MKSVIKWVMSLSYKSKIFIALFIFIIFAITNSSDNIPIASNASNPKAMSSLSKTEAVITNTGAESSLTQETSPTESVPNSESKITPNSTSACDPNYSGVCVPIASDVDCLGGSGNGPAYVKGPVNVIGNDIYGLDRDGNGIGCE